MIIRCYGARGSIPVSGEVYNRYGGDTTCLELRTENDDIIIVDAGSGIRRLGENLYNEERFDYNLIFTHSHMDHILGFPFFRPIYDSRTKINLLGCPKTQGNIQKLLSRSMNAPIFPIQFEDLKAEINYSVECALSFKIDSIEIFNINLSHPNGGMGYKFVEKDKVFIFLTDNELGHLHRGGKTPEEYIEFSKDADFLIHDAEYTDEEYEAKKTWGHSTYLEALELAIKANVKKLGLFHHNQLRFDDDLDAIVQNCRAILRERKIEMECFALTQDTEIVL